MKPLLTSLLLLLTTWSAAQSTAVRTEVSGTRSMTTVNAQQLHDELSALLAAQNLTATDVSALTAAFNGLPPIPTALSDLTNDVGYTTFNGDYSSLTNAPTSVTAFSDVSDAGSGAIITASERTLLASLSNALALIDSMSAELTLLQTANNLTFTCGGLYYFDGYAYETVQIGTQCWFAENLRSTHFNDGSEIPSGLSADDWEATEETFVGASAVYGEGDADCSDEPCDEVANLEDYGRLYNWYAVDDARGLCPSNWHVPSDEEWISLEMELGMSAEQASLEGWRGTDEGKKLKASTEDFATWGGYHDGNLLNVGFSAAPGGHYTGSANFYEVGIHAYFWSSSSSGSSAWHRELYASYDKVWRSQKSFENGMSVRCIWD